MPKIKFVVEHREVEVHAGRTVRDVAVEEGIDLDRSFFRGFNCRGFGLCGACKVWVQDSTPGATSRPNLRERFHGMGDGRRLACQTRVQGDVDVTSVPGGDDRLQAQRSIDPPPQPATDEKPSEV